ncbi:MAG: LCP family protein [Lactimicrobium sp.]|jgi:LCP family protein required for cell wall assembly|uniref:LCP family protein n=1 Tax=Lactimicrobium sp. TaxID=2563780 RepID=UPI002F354314
MESKKRVKPGVILWLVCVVLAIVAFTLAGKYGVLAGNRKLIAMVAAAAVLAVLLVLSLKKKGTAVVNGILAAVLALCCVLMPKLQSREASVFSEPAHTAVRTMNLYVMSADYRSDHSSTFSSTKPSENLEDYKNAKFIVQGEFDQQDQSDALDQLKDNLGVTSLSLVQKDTVSDALSALYNNEGDVLVLNQAFSSSVTSIARYASFESDTFVLDSIKLGDASAATAEETASSGDNSSFVIYVAGHDASSTSFSLYGRTDVDMIMAVNPVLKQVLMVSIPRDFYIKNPALDNGLDKLTHLGNDGIQNTLDGINQEFGLNITDYMLTDFDHLTSLVDEIGGITVNNPYAFSGMGYDFAAGTISLNGAQALAYSRERHSLDNGDYGRNQHQGIVMEGILNKIQENCHAGDYISVIKAAMNNFLTNVSLDTLLSVYTSTNNGQDWTYFKYHLGGEGTYDGTASMGFDRMLYVCKPFDSQVQFTRQQVEKVLNGEEIQMESLPDNANTTFEEN